MSAKKLLSPEANLGSFKTPFNRDGIRKLIATMKEAHSEQGAAADASASLMTGGIATHEGAVVWCYLVVGVAAETNEIMTVDVLLNGTSILKDATAVTIDADTEVDTIIPLELEDEDTVIAIGDKLTVTRNWTTGGGTDTLANTSVRVGWAPR